MQASIYALSVLLGQEPGALRRASSRPRPRSRAAVARSRSGCRRSSSSAAPTSARAEVGPARRDRAHRRRRRGSVSAVQPHGLVRHARAPTSGRSRDLANRFWSIGPSFTVPVFTGGRTQANIAQAQRHHLRARCSRTRPACSSRSRTSRPRSSASRASRSGGLCSPSPSSRTARRSTSRSSSTARERRTSSTCCSAQRSLYLTEAALAQSETEVGRNLVALYKALGGGWSECIP